jgi:hypothetical protein
MGGFPGGQPRGPIPGEANPNAIKGPAIELKSEPEKLPPNFKPPAVKDKLMDLEQPLALPDEIDKLKKDLPRFGTVLRTALSTDADKAVIKNGIRYRLAVMCLQKNRLELSKLHETLLRDLDSAAQAPAGNANATTIRAFRQMVLQELVTQVTPLLTSQGFHVRLHMAILLGELNITEETSKYNLKQEAYAPACEPLIQVISSPDQPEGVKVAAVNSIARILRNGNPNVAIRTKVTQALVAELGNKKTHPWYQMRLASTLASSDIDQDQGKPIVVNALKAVVTDDERTMAVRAEAARSLGRVPIPASAGPSSVTQAIAAFALKLAKAAQQSPQQKADDPKWKSEFFKVYLAFQQQDGNDVVSDAKKSKAGLLNNRDAGAKPAYDLIVPMVAAILHGQRLTAAQVQALETYVNPGGNNTQPVSAPAAPATQGTPASPRPQSETTGSDNTPTTLDAAGPKKL